MRIIFIFIRGAVKTFIPRAECAHTEKSYVRGNYYSMIHPLARFNPEHWPLNTIEEIQSWIEQGYDYARITQIQRICKGCNRLERIDVLLDRPFKRSEEEAKAASRAVSKVIDLVT